MSTSNRLRLSAIIVWLSLLVSSGLAQRPSTASVCDFYAQLRFGANSSDTQRRLVQNIVALAFEGGSRLDNVSSELTGILRPGTFNGANIDLMPWFNGSKASTNVNNNPIGINWLDQGGTVPLAAFLAGETETIVFANSSNQYHLFGNFFVVFSRVFGCTFPFPPIANSNGPVSLAYAHKFMNLEYNQIGYFIHQLTRAGMHFGFSLQDANTIAGSLNNRYNVRCAPAISLNPAMPPQLMSLCQHPSCPLAAPVSDCAAYDNLTANGNAGSNPTTVIQTATITGSAPTMPPTASTTPPSGPPAAEALSTGGIAGVAIGGAAVLILAVGLFLWFRRNRRKSVTSEIPAPTTPGWGDHHHHYSTPTLDPSSPYTVKDGHMSYYSSAHPGSDVTSSRYRSSRVGSPEMTMHPGYHQQHPMPPVEIGSPPAEMDGAPAATYQRPQTYGDEIQQHGDEIQQQRGFTPYHPDNTRR